MPKIIFIHPDLGIGGAERLVVDAAVALKERGHSVSFITSYHNKEHCFEETKNGTFNVTVVGNWIPRSVMGRFFALCAYLKMIYCALYVIFFENPDLVFCDLVSVCIPILHFSVKRIIYYCHYPDQLLSKKGSFIKRLYRLPLNRLEEITISSADKVYVNSEFTKKVYMATFKSMRQQPTVLYPSINTRLFDEIPFSKEMLSEKVKDDTFLFVSINRYERKKTIELAINGLIVLKSKVTKDIWNKIMLVIVGGYDPRVKENVEYFDDLYHHAGHHGMIEKIIFLKSLSDNDKVNLLRRCNCLIYTPPDEHFGIVPLEAMYCEKPVIACNSGGPTETVSHGKTGFLCPLDVHAFSDAMYQLVQDRDLGIKMGKEGHLRFVKMFSFDAFSNQLCNDVDMMLHE